MIDTIKNIAHTPIIKVGFLLLLILISMRGFSQKQTSSNPGFMGKHFIVSGEGQFSGAYFRYTKLWLKYGAASEIIISRKLSLGASYLYNTTLLSDFLHSDACYDYNQFNLSTHQLGLDLYIYKSRLAPIGFFYRLQFAMLFNNSTDFYKNGSLKSGKDPYSCRGYVDDKIKLNNFALNVFFGKKRVFFNSLVVSYGVQFGLTFLNPLTDRIKDSEIDPNDETGNSFVFRTAVAQENFHSTVIAFKMNVGFIW